MELLASAAGNIILLVIVALVIAVLVVLAMNYRKVGPNEVLIVASRLKDYVRAVSGYNTSDRALEPLSDIVRKAVDEAIRIAAVDERRTVLDRDIPKP